MRLPETEEAVSTATAARAVARIILVKAGYALSPYVEVRSENCHLLDAALARTILANRDESRVQVQSSTSAKSSTSAAATGRVPAQTHVGPFALDGYYVIDNVSAMRQLPDGLIGTIFTSPNYNKAGLFRTITGRTPSSAPLSTPGSWHHSIPYDVCNDNMDEADYRAQQIMCLKECCRTIKPGGLIFYNHAHRVVKDETFTIDRDNLFEGAGLKVFRIIYWHQGTSVQQNNNGPTPVLEPIYLLTPKHSSTAPRYNKKAVSKQFWTDLWQINKEQSTDHPCVFPQILVDNCIRLNSNEGDIILDPHAGSGSVLLGAYNRNRRFLGFDISENYQRAFLKTMEHDSSRSVISPTA